MALVASQAKPMGLINKIKSIFVAPIIEEKQEGMDMAQTLRAAGVALFAHLEALYALLKLELQEASQRLGKKAVLLLTAIFTGIFGYLFVWSLLTMIMAHYWGPIAGCAVTAGFHLLVSTITLIMFSRIRITPIAPATAEEIKTDLSCLQMALKKSSDS